MIHGGDITTFTREFGSIPIDFSANISPLGLPSQIKQELITSLDNIINYPDPLCRELTRAIARKDSQPYDNIICGNGASDTIFQLVNAVKPKTALVLAPTFAEYELALKSVGCQVEYYLLQEELDFQIQGDILDKVSNEVDIIFICQPNNPTGMVCDPVLLEKLVLRCQETQTYIAIDECFVDFLEDEERYSMLKLIEGNPYLIIIKAFTKMYAIAGLRLGYGVSSNHELLKLMRESSQAWGVSSLAQRAGVVACSLEEYVDQVKAIIPLEREYLSSNLGRLGYTVFPSFVNYIFFKSDTPQLDLILRRKGFMIRNCSNYVGLSQGYYRIAVKNRADNEKLIHALNS